MSTWEDRVNTSPAKLKSEELLTILGKVDQSRVTPEIRVELDRAQKIAETCLAILNGNDPELINPASLNSLSSTMSNAVSHLNTWINGSADSYITSYLAQEIDSATNYLPSLSIGVDVPGAREAIGRLRKSVAGHISAVNKLVDELKTRGTEADQSINDQLETARKEFEAVSSEVSELEDDLQAVKDSTNAIATEQQKAFTQAEANRSAEFVKSLEQTNERLANTLKDMEKAATDSINKIKTGVDKDKQSIKKSKTEIEELLGIVGEQTLVNDYSKTAKSERIAADVWSGFTVGSILLAVAFAFHFAKDVSDATETDPISWQYMVAKTVLVLSFGAIAGYAARQSSEHRHAQRESERMSLQLSAVPLYIKRLSTADKRDSLLENLADKLFDRPTLIQTSKSKKNTDENPIVTTQIIEALIELIKKNRVN